MERGGPIRPSFFAPVPTFPFTRPIVRGMMGTSNGRRETLTYTIVKTSKGKFNVQDEDGRVVSVHTWRRFAEEKVRSLTHE